MNKEEILLCPYCSAPFTKEMMDVYEGSYGCYTGCTTINVEVYCQKCGKEIYNKNGFGSVYEETTDEEWLKIVNKFNERNLASN